MAVFWSPVDERNISGLCRRDFMLSLVVNKAWDTLVRVDWFSPVRVTLDEIPLQVLLPDYEVSASVADGRSPSSSARSRPGPDLW